MSTLRKGFAEELVDSLSRSDVLEVMLKNAVVSTLITARVEKSMSQKQFAAFMGISQSMVSKWESGDCNFTIDTIAKICEKLNLVPTLELKKEEDYYALKEKNEPRWSNLVGSKPIVAFDQLNQAA